MKCVFKCSVSSAWKSLLVDKIKVAEGYLVSEICHWRSYIVYRDGAFEVVTCRGEAEQEKPVTLTCTDGVPLLIARELAMKIPLVEMLMRRGEVMIPFSTEMTKRAIELAAGGFIPESELPRDVVDYLFPGRENIRWIPMNPTMGEIASLGADLGDPLKLAVAWYNRTREHNYHLYALKSEAFARLMRLLTNWKLVELAELEQITIASLSDEEYEFLTLHHYDLGLSCIPLEIVRLLQKIVKDNPSVSKEYSRWAREVWPKHGCIWYDEELALENLSQIDRKELALDNLPQADREALDLVYAKIEG